MEAAERVVASFYFVIEASATGLAGARWLCRTPEVAI